LETLRQKTVSGAGWSFLGNITSQIVRFVIGIVLARMLLPGDYGLVGMLAIFISVGDALVESGFSQALIQKKDASNEDYSTVFFINFFIACLIFLLLCLTAPLIAKFYNEEQLNHLVIVLSIGIIIRSFTIIQATRFTKNLLFRELAIINVISTLISGLVSLPMALKGYGVWSLVGLSLSKDFTYSVLLWIRSEWKPSFLFKRDSAKNLFGFGSRILGVGLLDNFFLHINKLIIGKFFTAADLGFYTRAYGYRDMISKNILNITSSLAFPSFSSIQNDFNKVRTNYKKASELVTFISVPLLALMAFLAEPLIRILITDKWLPAVPYLQILCIAGIFYPVSGIQISILKALGKANEYLILNVIQKVFIIIGIVIGIKWGVIGLVYAQVFSMAIVYALGIYYMKKFLKLNYREQIIDFFKYTLLVILIFGTMYKITNYITTNDLALIIIQSFVDISVYFFISFYLKYNGAIEIVTIFKENFLPRLLSREAKNGMHN